MLFTTYVFLFAFLPVTWVMFQAARRWLPSLALPVLVGASLVFYGWWDIRFLPLLLGSIAVNFGLGRIIGAAVDRGEDGRAKLWMVVGVTLNLLTLGIFKYLDFLIVNLAATTGGGLTPLGIILPIGISFFTFQQIAYLVDVRRGQSDRYGPLGYALFVSFFPQLIAGPIVHHRDMMPQFARGLGPRAQDIALGLTLFIFGLFKKAVIADGLAAFASPVFGAADAGLDVSTAEAWGAALAYTFQIYFDFSGYSDMALGLARLFGIRLPVNFHSPYKATSIIDFWRRWHMTLSQFLRDYLYFALGGNRKGPARRHVNLMLTMVLGGIWHGAGWGFVIWGALHGAYLGLNHTIRASAAGRWLAQPGRGGRRALAIGLAWGATFLAVVFAWVFFRATTLGGAAEILGSMLGLGGADVPADYARRLGGLPETLGLSYGAPAVLGLGDWVTVGVPTLVAALLLALLAPNTNQIFLADDPYYRDRMGPMLRPARPAIAWRPDLCRAALAFALFVAALLYPVAPGEFLYFQF